MFWKYLQIFLLYIFKVEIFVHCDNFTKKITLSLKI